MIARKQLDRTEQALREREITFAALAKLAPLGLMHFDANGRCNYVNDRWSELSGLSIDEAIGDGWLNAIKSKIGRRSHTVGRVCGTGMKCSVRNTGSRVPMAPSAGS